MPPLRLPCRGVVPRVAASTRSAKASAGRPGVGAVSRSKWRPAGSSVVAIVNSFVVDHTTLAISIAGMPSDSCSLGGRCGPPCGTGGTVEVSRRCGLSSRWRACSGSAPCFGTSPTVAHQPALGCGCSTASSPTRRRLRGGLMVSLPGQARASMTRLVIVDAATCAEVKPASRNAWVRRAGPAWAPNAAPPSETLCGTHSAELPT